MRYRLLTLGVVTALAFAGACGDTSSDSGEEAQDGAAAGPGSDGTASATSDEGARTVAPGGAGVSTVALADVRLGLTQVATLDQPLAMTQRPGDDAFYVAEKEGRVRLVRGGEVAADPVLDLSEEVTAGGEQGLLGIAFSPDGSRFYASFTDTAGHSRLWEYPAADGAIDSAGRRELLMVEQPFPNHNGGQVMFGSDGLLYFFLGDGGSGGDPMRNGQNLGVLLGKVLRIDPTPTAGAPYTIPPDNPFVGTAGARGEIWAYGLRNPWRNSFDRATGDLWIGDVGQSKLEEVDVAGAGKGANFGWNIFEGSERFTPAVPAPADAVAPVHEYPTSDGCAVTGGYVYGGTKIPALAGAYVYGDFCNGGIRALRVADGRKVEDVALNLTTEQLASFGEDANGELYAFSLSGGLFRIDPA